MATTTFTRPMTSTRDQVWARLLDPQVAESRARAEGVNGSVTRHEPGADQVVIGIDTPVPDSWLPAMARGHQATVRRVETWHDGDALTGDMSLQIAGAPGTASCRMSIGNENGTLVARYDISLTVSVPLIGKSIEASILPRIAGVLEDEVAILDGRA